MPTKVKIKADDPYQHFKNGMIGYIDGYMRGGNGQPCAVVIVQIKNEKKIFMVPISDLVVDEKLILP